MVYSVIVYLTDLNNVWLIEYTHKHILRIMEHFKFLSLSYPFIHLFYKYLNCSNKNEPLKVLDLVNIVPQTFPEGDILPIPQVVSHQ